jgi:hypothetical protein
MQEKYQSVSRSPIGLLVNTENIFGSIIPLKAEKRKISIRAFEFFFAVVAEYAEWNLTYADNTWNEM